MKLPRFTLRELFLLVVIAAMGCGWWVREQEAKATWDRHIRVANFFSNELCCNSYLVDYHKDNIRGVAQVASATWVYRRHRSKRRCSLTVSS